MIRSVRSIACCLFLGLSAGGFAQDGVLDPGFGTGGKVRFGIAGSDALIAKDMALTSSGQVLALATLELNGTHYAALCRFQSSGPIDMGFGEGGVLHIGPDDMDVEASALEVLPDGHIVVLASITDGDDHGFLLARLDAEGGPDDSFGTNGISLVWPDAGYSYQANDLVQVADNELVVGGGCTLEEGDKQALLMRFKPSGALDLTFGTNGLALHGLGDMGAGFFEERIEALVYDAAANTLWATGECVIPNAPGQRAYKLKTDASGALMTFQGPYFGWGGGPSSAADIALDASGRVVIIGTNGDDEMSYVQCDDEGALEHDGSSWFADQGYSNSEGRAVAVDWNGRILLAGTVIATNGDRHFAIERLVGECETDTDFGDDGQVITPVGVDGWAEPRAMALQADGSILLLGTSWSGGKQELGLVRYLAPDGVDVAERTGIDGSLELFPNPATDALSIRFTGDGSPANIELVDATGRIVVRSFRGRGDTLGAVLQTMALPSGTAPGHYLLRLTDDRGVRTGRVIVL